MHRSSLGAMKIKTLFSNTNKGFIPKQKKKDLVLVAMLFENYLTTKENATKLFFESDGFAQRLHKK